MYVIGKETGLQFILVSIRMGYLVKHTKHSYGWKCHAGAVVQWVDVLSPGALAGALGSN